jgi:peptidyl-prolyl cis-trans isomerase D
MLQTIRDKITGWFAYLFLGAIAIVFVFWGVEMRSTSANSYAAKVNGDRISREVVNRAWQERQQQLQQMMRGEIPEPIRKAQQEALLDEHIRTQLLTQQARKLGYSTSDAQIRETLNSIPDLIVDGSFSRQRYALLLRQQGRTEAQFESELRASLQIQQLQNAIAGSAFVTPAELQRRQALEGEQREIDYATVQMAPYLATAKVSDSDIQAWYDAHKSDYMTDETVDVEYLELRLADVEKDIEVSDAALKEYYEQVKERLTTQERRMGRHILISIGDGVDDAAAKAKAEEVLAKVNAGGDFAALAKQYSQDSVSAAKGGDLGWASRGMFVGPFEDALFAMEPGEVRGPIQTQFGYHVIKLEAKEGGETKSFEAAREELAREYKTEKAQTLFYDLSQKLGDETFNALTELETPAKALGLNVQKVAGFSRAGGGALGGDPKIVEAAFMSDAIEKKQNSPLIQVADDHVVVLRVAEHHAPEQKALPVVRADIESKLKQQAARDAAAKRGTELLARVESGADWNKALAEFKIAPAGTKLVTRSDASLPAPIKQNAFAVSRSMVSADKPVYRGTTVDNGDYSVIRVSAIHPGKLDSSAADNNAKRQQAAQSISNDEFAAYIAAVESKAKIERSPNVFD